MSAPFENPTTAGLQRPVPARRFHRRTAGKLISTHHRAVGLGYLAIAVLAATVGAILSLVMRLHLAWPQWSLPLHGPILPEEYLALVTMHGTLMLFFLMTVAPQSGFGNLILPAQIGATRMAFPRLNALGMWLTAVKSGCLLRRPKHQRGEHAYHGREAPV